MFDAKSFLWSIFLLNLDLALLIFCFCMSRSLSILKMLLPLVFCGFLWSTPRCILFDLAKVFYLCPFFPLRLFPLPHLYHLRLLRRHRRCFRRPRPRRRH